LRIAGVLSTSATLVYSFLSYLDYLMTHRSGAASVRPMRTLAASVLQSSLRSPLLLICKALSMLDGHGNIE
jgi:hypothetical protein